MIQKWKKRVAAILLILGGIGLVGYPWISDWCYRVHTQSSVAVYAAEAKEQSDVTEQLMQDAIAYNTWLSEAHITLSDPFSRAQIVEKPELPYTSQLALDDSGILAFIEIPKLHVYLPVYHTTSAEVLQRGAGHMEGTALPVGGAGNRPVISAHSGMNRAQMFSDLSDLETEDLFLIHVLDETLTYQVCDMTVILPEDTQALAPEKDRDLVSLVTCTPYGINTHRLVVTGERTYETASGHKTEDKVTSTWRHAYLNALLLGFGIAGGAGVMIRILSRHRQKVREQ
jgi:sortase A